MHSDDNDSTLELKVANDHRSTASTAMNASSSRSHMVLMVDVSTRTNGGAWVTGRLNLVDLAGSERVAKSGACSRMINEWPIDR